MGADAERSEKLDRAEILCEAEMDRRRDRRGLQRLQRAHAGCLHGKAVAGEAAGALVEKLTGSTPSDAAAASAVDAASKG